MVVIPFTSLSVRNGAFTKRKVSSFQKGPKVATWMHKQNCFVPVLFLNTSQEQQLFLRHTHIESRGCPRPALLIHACPYGISYFCAVTTMRARTLLSLAGSVPLPPPPSGSCSPCSPWRFSWRPPCWPAPPGSSSSGTHSTWQPHSFWASSTSQA